MGIVFAAIGGCMFGAMLGVFTMALLIASKDREE